MADLCRDCLATGAVAGPGCPTCGSARLVRHNELHSLAVAHVDCDAFYASVEKRDHPDLRDHPVIVGGGARGVVTTCCYIARKYGVHSAMPMFRALKACPTAVVVRPNMGKYREAARQVRQIMEEVTPVVEPISVDEAFLDLAGTERLHGRPAAASLAALALRLEREVGIDVSIGLSFNKSLAKIASTIDKPRGFAAVGRADALAFLEHRPVSVLWGVGPVLQRRLEADGIRMVGALRPLGEAELVRRYGAMGRRIARLALGQDPRPVRRGAGRKSLSSERTLPADVADPDELARLLWPLCETVAAGLKKEGLGARTVTLKLKSADFRLRTRSRTLTAPTALAETLYRTAGPLLEREATGTKFRLIGVAASGYAPLEAADPVDLADPGAERRKEVESTVDALRARFGRGAIGKGRGLES